MSRGRLLIIIGSIVVAIPLCVAGMAMGPTEVLGKSLPWSTIVSVVLAVSCAAESKRSETAEPNSPIGGSSTLEDCPPDPQLASAGDLGDMQAFVATQERKAAADKSRCEPAHSSEPVGRIDMIVGH